MSSLPQLLKYNSFFTCSLGYIFRTLLTSIENYLWSQIHRSIKILIQKVRRAELSTALFSKLGKMFLTFELEADAICVALNTY